MSRVLSAVAALLLSSFAAADNHTQQTFYGQSFQLIVSDPAAVAAAMRNYRNSETGQQLQNSVALSQVIANGTNKATHTINVFYPSAAAMDANEALTAESEDSAAFFATMSEIVEVESTNVFSVLQSRIKEGAISSDTPVTMLFGLNVTDQGAFMAALNRILDSEAAEAFPGNMFFGQVVAMGSSPSTHWVSFVANDMASLLEGVDAFMASDDFAQYAENANEFRSVTGRFISRQMLQLAPPEG